MTKVAMMLEQMRADRLGATAKAPERVGVSGRQTKDGSAGSIPSRSDAIEEPPSRHPTPEKVDLFWLRPDARSASGLGFALWHRFRIHVRQMLTFHPSH
jgi:hypothetical protein